jgi:hypothetical protein
LNHAAITLPSGQLSATGFFFVLAAAVIPTSTIIKKTVFLILVFFFVSRFKFIVYSL